jgi:hypothetical protein
LNPFMSYDIFRGSKSFIMLYFKWIFKELFINLFLNLELNF